jgi:hypothetical protein
MILPVRLPDRLFSFDTNIRKGMIVPFKSDNTEYTGFSHYRAGARRIVIATFDGDADLYSVDDGINPSVAIEEIKRMYRVGYDREPELIVGYDYEGYPALPETV